MKQRKITLADLCDFVRGVTFGKNDVVASKRASYVPILRAGNIGDELNVSEDLVWVPSSFVEEEQKLREDDVVICMSSGSSDVVGKTARALSTVNASVGAFCGIIRAKDRKQARLLSYYFRSPAFSRERDKIARGANIQNLRFSAIEDIKLQIPDNLEALTQNLDQADRIRCLRRYMLELSESLLQSVFVEMFGDPEINPKKWDRCIIDDVVKVSQYGTSVKSNSVKRGYPVLGMANITYSGRVVLDPMSYVELNKKDFEDLRLMPRDVIFNRTNSTDLVGKTAHWDYEMDAVLASYLIKIRLNPEMNPIFFSALLNTRYFKRLFQERCKKAVGQSNISPTLLKEFAIYKPPINEQERFERISGKVEKTIEVQRESLRQAEHLFQTLLQQAFSETADLN